MIYLKEKKILFIKPLKTASTSVEIALSCNASAEDIVTPISSNYELLRLEMNGQMPVNYANDRRIEDQYKNSIIMLKKLHSTFSFLDLDQLDKFLKLFYRGKGKKLFFNHIKPEKIIELKGQKFLDDSFVVTMCRHPYEVLVSRVYWSRWKSQGITDFDLTSAIDIMLEKGALNLDYYFYDGKYVPDFVIRYENLHEDLRELEERFDLKLMEKLPFTKHKVRKAKEPAKDVLTERQKEICFEYNKQIFEQFGYEK